MQEVFTLFSQMMTMPFQIAERFTVGISRAQPCGCTAVATIPTPPVLPAVKAECRTDDWQCGDDVTRYEITACCGVGCQCGGRSCRSECPCAGRTHHTGSDRVRLVEYSLCRVTRGASTVLQHGEEIFDNCTSLEEIQNELIFRYACDHPKHCKHDSGGDLRVYLKVLDTWCKPAWDYEEAQIAVLKQISNRIPQS